MRGLLFTFVLGLIACTGSALPPPILMPAGGHNDSAPGRVEIEAIGFRNDRGEARFALFTASRGFPEGKYAAQHRTVKVVRQRAHAEFIDLAPGTYAIAVLHDEDGDGAMETGFLGIPKEGYAASNNARRRFGAPEWGDATFAIAAGAAVTQRIRLIYH